MGESLLVLHLDDDLTILDHISRALGKTGPATGVTFTTEGFHNPLAFSERLGRDPVPDVVLLDIDLGHELTGRDMLQRVRQALPAEDLPQPSQVFHIQFDVQLAARIPIGQVDDAIYAVAMFRQ